MMESDIEETHAIASFSDVSDGTSTYEAFSSHEPKDELSSPEMKRARIETSNTSLSTESVSVPSFIAGLTTVNKEGIKSSTHRKTTSESEEKYHDSYLSKTDIKSDNEETHSKSYVADTFHEISREDFSCLETADKPSELNLPVISEKPSSPFRTMDRLLSADAEDKHSSTPTNIFSDSEETKSDISYSMKQTNFVSEEISSQSPYDRILSNEEIPSDCQLKDGFLLEKKESSKIETTSEISSNSISSLSEKPTETNADIGLPQHTTPNKPRIDTACSKLIISSPVCDDSSASTSYSSVGDYYNDDEDIQRFCQQQNLASSDEEMPSGCQLKDGSLLEKKESSKIETLSEISFNSIFLLSEEPAKFIADIGLPQHTITNRPQPQTNNASPVLAELNDGNHGRTDLIESNETSDRNNGIRSGQSEEVEPSESYLLRQVQEYFLNNTLDYEIMSWKESINRITASRYFNEEFAEQHGLTVGEDEVDRIRNGLEEDTAVPVTGQSHEPCSYLRRFLKLLERRPFSILVALLKFYLSSYNTYSY